MRWLAALVPLLLSGCIFLDAGHCGLHPEFADWQDRGLWDAMPADGSRAGAVFELEPPAGGLPLANASLQERWPGFALARVAWTGGELALTLEPDGAFHGRGPADLGEAALRDAADRVLRLALAASPDERAVLVDAFVASAQHPDPPESDRSDQDRLHGPPQATWQARTEGPYRLDALRDELHLLGALTRSDRGPVGTAAEDAGAWSFQYELPVKRAAHEGKDYKLHVDPLGRAGFEGLRMGEAPAKQYEAVVRAELAHLGLPAPGQMHVGGSIC